MDFGSGEIDAKIISLGKIEELKYKILIDVAGFVLRDKNLNKLLLGIMFLIGRVA